MKSKPGMWLVAIATQCTISAALAANPELVDYSCPTSPNDQPNVFSEGTEPLTYPAVLHIKDHSQDYRLTFTPAYNLLKGYVGTLIITGLPYTLDPATQTKTYQIGKSQFRQQVLNIPINFCRSHRIPYIEGGENKLGIVKIEDESGNTKTAWTRLKGVLSCEEDGCDIIAIQFAFIDRTGALDNVELGQGENDEDIRILNPAR